VLVRSQAHMVTKKQTEGGGTPGPEPESGRRRVRREGRTRGERDLSQQYQDRYRGTERGEDALPSRPPLLHREHLRQPSRQALL
jgi:hypothetical protein